MVFPLPNFFFACSWLSKQAMIAQVEKGAQIAAGAVVSPGTIIPAGEIWGGNPAKMLRALKPEEAAFISKSAQHYAELGAEHLKTTH